MTQISKRSLNKDTEKRLYDIFTQVITDATSQSDITDLLSDFLITTEREMLPKRLCIAYLLSKKHDQRSISHYLNVSFTTITKVSTAMKNGGNGYKTMLERIAKKKAYSALLESIELGIVGETSYSHSMADRSPDIL